MCIGYKYWLLSDAPAPPPKKILIHTNMNPLSEIP